MSTLEMEILLNSGLFLSLSSKGNNSLLNKIYENRNNCANIWNIENIWK